LATNAADVNKELIIGDRVQLEEADKGRLLTTHTLTILFLQTRQILSKI